MCVCFFQSHGWFNPRKDPRIPINIVYNVYSICVFPLDIPTNIPLHLTTFHCIQMNMSYKCG